MSAQLKEAPTGTPTGTVERCAEAVRHHRAGRSTEAERIYREILSVDPSHADSLQLLGVLAYDAGKYNEAVGLIGRALERAPAHPVAHHNLGNALLGLGRTEEAIAAYQAALQLEPGRAATHYTLANAWLRSGRAEEAVGAYQRALALQPDHPRAWNNLGNALSRLGRWEEAVEAYRKALELEPGKAYTANNLANALRESGCSEQALVYYDRAASSREPGAECPLTNKALLLMETGDACGARAAIAQALAINPYSVPAWDIHASLKKFTRTDADLAALETLLAAADERCLSTNDRIYLRFTLGKAWLDAGDAERAFAHLDSGNRLKRSTINYDGALACERIAAIADSFTPQLLQKLSGVGHPSEAPVFVLGMPRSGTTLVEQVLASHPEAHGAGELRSLRQLVPGVSPSQGYPYPPLYPPLLAQLSPADLARLGREYESRARAPDPRKRRVIDKMPANFLYAGFIHAILPNARIIHCRRDPRDTCLSCYTHVFGGDIAFAYDLRELGLYYRHYETLMARWRAILPSERYIELHYEDVVADLEREARRLVAFCGLEWNDACLAFHQTHRVVRTASANEVRRPIYDSSVGRWRLYGRHLGPLFDALRG
jgi:tetratricopeptide (TPR) repeat protein